MPNAQADSGPFADALVAIGRAAEALPRIEAELARVLPLLVQNDSVRAFLSDPTILIEGKRKAIEELLGNQVHPALLCFLCFLADERRLPRLAEIAAAFFEKTCATRKETDGELVSAAPLAQEKITIIEEEIGRMLNKKVRLRLRVDPGNLGGLYVHVGDFVVDGTLDRQLAALGRTLLS